MWLLKKDDIFTDWSLWSVVGSIALSKFWLEYGLSSSQVRTDDIRNVVLPVVVFLGHTPLYPLVWPMLSPCSHNCGIPLIWKPRWIVVEPISNIFISSMIRVEHSASIGNLYKHYLRVSFMKNMLGWKKWLPLVHVHWMQDATVNSRKHVFTSYGIIPSRSCTCAKYFVVC